VHKINFTKTKLVLEQQKTYARRSLKALKFMGSDQNLLD